MTGVWTRSPPAKLPCRARTCPIRAHAPCTSPPSPSSASAHLPRLHPPDREPPPPRFAARSCELHLRPLPRRAAPRQRAPTPGQHLPCAFWSEFAPPTIIGPRLIRGRIRRDRDRQALAAAYEAPAISTRDASGVRVSSAMTPHADSLGRGEFRGCLCWPPICVFAIEEQCDSVGRSIVVLAPHSLRARARTLGGT